MTIDKDVSDVAEALLQLDPKVDATLAVRALERIRERLASVGRDVRRETILVDCGHSATGVCAKPPGCLRCWAVCNRELVEELRGLLAARTARRVLAGAGGARRGVGGPA